MLPDVSWTWGGFFQLVGFLFCAGVTLALAFYCTVFFCTFVVPNLIWPGKLWAWIQRQFGRT